MTIEHQYYHQPILLPRHLLGYNNINYCDNNVNMDAYSYYTGPKHATMPASLKKLARQNYCASKSRQEKTPVNTADFNRGMGYLQDTPYPQAPISRRVVADNPAMNSVFLTPVSYHKQRQRSTMGQRRSQHRTTPYNNWKGGYANEMNSNINPNDLRMKLDEHRGLIERAPGDEKAMMMESTMGGSTGTGLMGRGYTLSDIMATPSPDLLSPVYFHRTRRYTGGNVGINRKMTFDRWFMAVLAFLYITFAVMQLPVGLRHLMEAKILVHFYFLWALSMIIICGIGLIIVISLVVKSPRKRYWIELSIQLLVFLLNLGNLILLRVDKADILSWSAKHDPFYKKSLIALKAHTNGGKFEQNIHTVTTWFKNDLLLISNLGTVSASLSLVCTLIGFEVVLCMLCRKRNNFGRLKNSSMLLQHRLNNPDGDSCYY